MSNGGPGAARRLRADALRNRQLLLGAAEEVFAAEGVNAPVDRIAERAGVGVGTLYRHFPTKESLFEAIVGERLGALSSAVGGLAGSPEPGAAFFDFIERFAREAVAKRDLFEAFSRAGFDIKARCQAPYEQLKEGVEELLRRAQRAGAVREDLTGEELMILVMATCEASGAASPGLTERVLRVVCDGLRAR